MREPVIAALSAVEAVVFDTDEVITDAARLHAAARKTAFDTCLRDHPPSAPDPRRPFDPREDCPRYVDGRPRMDGAASFLAARGMRLGTPAGRTAVVEDALAGVEADRRGGFGPVVGVDRTPEPDSAAALLRHGADLVVRDLADLLSDGADDAKG